MIESRVASGGDVVEHSVFARETDSRTFDTLVMIGSSCVAELDKDM